MKDYYKKTADKAERQLKLLVPGFELKAKEIGLKLAEAESADEKEQLVEDLLDLSEVLKEVRDDYKTNLKKYQEACKTETSEGETR